MANVSANERPEPAAEDGGALRRLPTYELEFLFDEDESPNEVTIFVDDVGELATSWLTIDVEHAVPLEEVR